MVSNIPTRLLSYTVNYHLVKLLEEVTRINLTFLVSLTISKNFRKMFTLVKQPSLQNVWKTTYKPSAYPHSKTCEFIKKSLIRLPPGSLLISSSLNSI